MIGSGMHGFPPYDRGSYRVGYRHDLLQYQMNYGFSYCGRFDGGRNAFEAINVEENDMC